jgi:hypothetical protein
VVNVIGVALFAFVAQTSPPQPGTATVDGIVMQSGGQPLSGAKVQLVRASPRRNDGSPAREGGLPPEDLRDMMPRSATTAQDGRFRFDDVKPGEYRLLAAKSGGYVPGEFGQRSPTGTGITFELSAGQTLRGVQLVLTPSGSISGHVYDRDGPLGKIQVHALRPVYREGRRSLTIVQSVQTNDRGEYRVFWLPPGAYFLSAKPANEGMLGNVRITEPIRVGTFEEASGPLLTTRTSPTGEVIEEIPATVYYPGTTELAAASRIDVRAGMNAEGIDIPLTSDPVRTRHVRGVAMMNGQPVGSAGIVVIPRSLAPSLVIPSARSTADGSFDVAGVSPGDYYVFGTTNGGMTGGLALQVGDADVDNVIVSVAAGFKWSGRFVLEGRVGAATDMSLLRVTFTREPSLVGMPESGPSFTPPPSADGSFVVEGVPPGDFRIGVRALPADAYIASMRMGTLDVLDAGLHLSAPPRAPLEIVIRDAGILTGTVVNSRQEPVANSRVVVVPEAARRHRADLYRSTSTDRAGRFQLRGIASGTYAVLAWEDVEDGAWQDPEFVRPYEDRASSIRMRDGATETIQLTAISAR